MPRRKSSATRSKERRQNNRVRNGTVYEDADENLVTKRYFHSPLLPVSVPIAKLPIFRTVMLLMYHSIVQNVEKEHP
jgi:hypothetical protein